MIRTIVELDSDAKSSLDYLNNYCAITIHDNDIVEDYPVIKGNIDKEKICHLPFDQQYDHVDVTKNIPNGLKL